MPQHLVLDVGTIGRQFQETRERLKRYTFLSEHIIPDYPLPGDKRGQMRIAVEYRPNYGSRLIRQAHAGRRKGWLRPVLTSYLAKTTAAVVVPTEHSHLIRAGFLVIDPWYVVIEYANGQRELLSACPLQRPPRRTPEVISLLRASLSGDGPQRVPHFERPADPAELIEAFDAWTAHATELAYWARAQVDSGSLQPTSAS